jgi:hypothetical protein
MSSSASGADEIEPRRPTMCCYYTYPTYYYTYYWSYSYSYFYWY